MPFGRRISTAPLAREGISGLRTFKDPAIS